MYAVYGTPAENLCFTGDTIVQAYGGNKRISEIRKGDLVYSFNGETKRIELKPVVSSMLTKKNAVIVTVRFDNGQSIRCTPEHPFAKRVMVQDEFGRFVRESLVYVKARDLKCGDRIKSNYISIDSGGHYKCSTGQWIHDINAEFFLGEKPVGHVVHHKDTDKLNNMASNLEYITDREHRRLHISDNIGMYKFKPGQNKGRNNSFYGHKHSKSSIQKNRIKHLGKNNALAKPVVQLDLSGNIVHIYESRGIAESKAGVSNISYACNGRYITKKNPHEYKGSLWYFAKDIEDITFENHKVLSVEYEDYLEDVYDIEVEDNHNFYVGGDDGILVHNCGLQVRQFRKKYGIVENVSDREYVSNSFHCHVTENMSPIEKQDKEGRFWNLFNGGKIQYVRYPVAYNVPAIRILVRRAMELGFYEGVNLALSYCDDCGHEQLEMDTCPCCGSQNLTKIDRMNGYLSYSRVKGDTRLNKAKMAEIAERRSM